MSDNLVSEACLLDKLVLTYGLQDKKKEILPPEMAVIKNEPKGLTTDDLVMPPISLNSPFKEAIARAAPGNNKFADSYFVGLERLNSLIFTIHEKFKIRTGGKIVTKTRYVKEYTYDTINTKYMNTNQLLDVFVRAGCVANMDEAKGFLNDIPRDYIPRDNNRDMGGLVFRIKKQSKVEKGEYLIESML